MKIEVIREGQFRGDVRLNQTILSLMSDVYEDPTVPMEEETALSDTLYLIWDDNRDLQFFHFVKWHNIEVDGESMPALYSAWMGAKETVRTDGTKFGVFRYLLADMLRWQQDNGKKLIYWGTTATLAVYLLCLRNLVNTRPNLDGSYSESDERIARGCQRWLGAQSHHPFALHDLTKARYTHRELRKLRVLAEQKNITLFDKLEIEPAKGDQLLVFGYLPDVEISSLVGE